MMKKTNLLAFLKAEIFIYVLLGLFALVISLIEMLF